jgi:hypothetical protein
MYKDICCTFLRFVCSSPSKKENFTLLQGGNKMKMEEKRESYEWVESSMRKTFSPVKSIRRVFVKIPLES